MIGFLWVEYAMNKGLIQEGIDAAAASETDEEAEALFV